MLLCCYRVTDHCVREEKGRKHVVFEHASKILFKKTKAWFLSQMYPRFIENLEALDLFP